jgi:hypothetical protein
MAVYVPPVIELDPLVEWADNLISEVMSDGKSHNFDWQQEDDKYKLIVDGKVYHTFLESEIPCDNLGRDSNGCFYSE